MVGALLISIRKQMGFQSARRFYNEHLDKKTRLEFNYQYYMKIEGNKVLPSPKIISSISVTLPEEFSDQLVVAYCETIFPTKRLLFQKMKKPTAPTAHATKAVKTLPTLVQQQYLTESQVGIIGKSQQHYYVFLAVTIARGSILIPELKKKLKIKDMKSILEDLIVAKLVTCENNYVTSISNEMKFPTDVSVTLRKTYDQIDAWNIQAAQYFDFANSMQKMIIRRVSPRYIELILNQANGLFDILRAADETNQSYNEEVMMMNLTISQGKLPG